jgi:hypothetical protein
MRFIPVYSFDNYIDAHLKLGLLQEEGINCWLMDEHTVTIDPIVSNAIGGIKLMVHEVQVERARELLEQIVQREKAGTLCPHCGSANVELIVSNRKPVNWFSAVASFLLGNYAVAPGKKLHCFSCGKEF